MNDLTAARFTNEEAARKHMENMRWADGVHCPLCGCTDRIIPMTVTNKPTAKNPKPKEKKGYFHCGACRQKFTVRTGTIYERSHIPLHKWLLATHLVCASKKGMSAHQLHRMLGITYKSAWFMEHRIREAMNDANPGPMGGPGEAVQADETYIGKKAGPMPTVTTSGRPFTKKGGAKRAHKRAVVSLISEGKARTFHVERADSHTVGEILRTNASRESELHTDESNLYTKVGKEYAAHETVNHSSGQYVNKRGAHNNGCETTFRSSKEE